MNQTDIYNWLTPGLYLKKDGSPASLPDGSISASTVAGSEIRSYGEVLPEGITSGEVDGNLSFVGGFIQSKNFVSGSAGWRLSADGTLEAINAELSGNVTATTGMIGGFSIGSDYIRDTANSMGLASTVSGSDDVRFWAGDTYANRATAPFRVTEAGAVTVSNLTVTGGSIATETVVNAPIVANFIPIQTMTQNDAVFINNDALVVDTAVQIVDNLNIGDASSNTRVAQSFNESSGYIFDKIRVFLQKVGTPSDTLTFAIQADSAGSPSGTDLATATITGGSLTATVTEYELTFNTSIVTTASTAYWIVARRSGSVNGLNFFRWWGRQANAYANGTFATYNGSAWSNQTWDAHFRLFYSSVQPSTIFDPSVSILVAEQWGNATAQTRAAQSFAESSSYTFDQVKIYMCRQGTPSDTITCSIQADSGSDSPSGTDLASGTYSGSSIVRADSGAAAEEITFRLNKPITASANTKYWIVLQRSGSVDASHYYYTFGSSSSAYANGKYATYDPTTWTVSATKDMEFKLCLSSSTPALRKTRADLTGYYESFLGFVKTTTLAGTSCPVIISGLVTTFTNLSQNRGQYYLSDTPGAISTTQGTNVRKVGVATSMTNLLITNIW